MGDAVGGVQNLRPEEVGEGRWCGWEPQGCGGSEGKGIMEASRTGTELWGGQVEPEERGHCSQGCPGRAG